MALQVVCEGNNTTLSIPGCLAFLLVIKSTDNLPPRANDVYALLRPVRECPSVGVVAALKLSVVLRNGVLHATEPKTSRRRLACFDDRLKAILLTDSHLLGAHVVLKNF